MKTWMSNKYQGHWSELDNFYQEFENKNNKLNKLKQIIHSRTIWTLVVLFVINGVGAIHNSIPVNVLPVVDGILGILAVYFKVNTTTDYR